MAYQLRGLVFSYAGRRTLDIEELRFEPQRVTALTGPNGAGKSTLFDLLAFLRAPERGEILFQGGPTTDANLAALRRRVGYVQQNPYLVNMSVRDNIGLGLRFRGRGRAAVAAAVNEAAAELGLQPLLERAAGDLSGGETQKVALARALAPQPGVVIMDEPFTHLDEGAARDIEQWLAAQRAARKRTIIFSTHDRLRAQALSDAGFNLVDGRVYPLAPGNLFSGAVDAAAGEFVSGGARFALPEGVRTGNRLFIEPQHLVVSRARLSSSMRNNFCGAIVSMNAVNGEIFLEVEAGVTFTVIITRQSLEAMNLRLGEQVWVSCKSSRLVVI